MKKLLKDELKIMRAKIAEKLPRTNGYCECIYHIWHRLCLNGCEDCEELKGKLYFIELL